MTREEHINDLIRRLADTNVDLEEAIEGDDLERLFYLTNCVEALEIQLALANGGDNQFHGDEPRGY